MDGMKFHNKESSDEEGSKGGSVTSQQNFHVKNRGFRAVCSHGRLFLQL